MTAIVLDVSLTLSWLFEDEATPATWALMDRVKATGAIVPDIWFYELANVLTQAQRGRRITPNEIDAFLRDLGALDLRRTPAAPSGNVRALVVLASASGLSAYDAAYLELALRLSLPLATLDQKLARASRKAGVVVLPDA